jgi:hypothetical protein
MTTKKNKGLELKRHFNPKYKLHFVPYILQILLPLVDKYIVEETIAEYIK